MTSVYYLRVFGLSANQGVPNATGRPGADRLNVASGRPYPRSKCEVGIRHFRDSLLTRDGEDSWCRGPGTNY